MMQNNQKVGEDY